jgi:transposase
MSIAKEKSYDESKGRYGSPKITKIKNSFNTIFKKEDVSVNNYSTFNEARLAIFEFIDNWYNNKRFHSTLGYITQNEKYYNYINN